MKITTKTLKSVSAILEIMPSPRNTNSNKVSGRAILEDIIANSWKPDSLLIVAGDNVAGQAPNTALDCDNRVWALNQLSEEMLAKVAKIGVRVEYRHDMTEQDVNDVYNTAFSSKTVNRAMLACAIHFENFSGVSRADLSLRYRIAMDALFNTSKSQVDELEKIQKMIDAGIEDESALKKAYGEIRNVSMRNLRCAGSNIVTLKMYHMKEGVEMPQWVADAGDVDEILAKATNGDFQALNKAWQKDVEAMSTKDGLPCRMYTREELQLGQTIEFQQALEKLVKDITKRELKKAEKKESGKKSIIINEAMLLKLKDSSRSNAGVAFISALLGGEDILAAWTEADIAFDGK